MTEDRELLRSAWLWVTGLACLALPFFWWPRPFSGMSFLHATVFIAALGWVIRSGRKGRLFDGERAPIRGYAGVLAFSGVFFGGFFAYRWLILE